MTTRLRRFDIFEDYTEDELTEALAYFEERTFAANDVICRERAPGDSCFFLTEGVVEVRTNLATGKAEVIGRLKVGSIFGQIVLLDGGSRSATCVAQTDVTLFELRRATFESLMASGSRLAFDLMHEIAVNLAEQVRQATDSLSAMSESRVEDPLAISKRLQSFVRGQRDSQPGLRIRDIKL